MWSNLYREAPKRLRRWLLVCYRCCSKLETSYLSVAAWRSKWHPWYTDGDKDEYFDEVAQARRARAWCGRCRQYSPRVLVERREVTALGVIAEEPVMDFEPDLGDDVEDVLAYYALDY